MTKKVHELAKELNVTSKELLEIASHLGIYVTSHMCVLSDTEIDKIKRKSSSKTGSFQSTETTGRKTGCRYRISGEQA